jgi:hypothetical protein
MDGILDAETPLYTTKLTSCEKENKFHVLVLDEQ